MTVSFDHLAKGIGAMLESLQQPPLPCAERETFADTMMPALVDLLGWEVTLNSLLGVLDSWQRAPHTEAFRRPCGELHLTLSRILYIAKALDVLAETEQ